MAIALKKRRINHLGTEGYDHAVMAGPYTPWPDVAWTWSLAKPFPGPAANAEFLSILSGEDLEVSQGHPFQKLGETREDLGGTFACYRQFYEQSPPAQSYDFSDTSDPSSAGYHYRGPQFAAYKNVGLGTYPEPARSSHNALVALGATAVARCIPTNPIFDLTTFLGELREGIPRVAGTDFFRNRTDIARSAGSEYLNLEFGWRPLVNDVQSFAYAVKNHDAILKQYERNSGKRVKRRLMLTNETTTETTVVGTGYTACPTPVLPIGCFSSSSGTELTRTRTISLRQWFEGCFTYYLEPEKSGIQGRIRWLQEANKLYGVRLTPETLWNLTPWSWGADWFGNVGDVLHNASAFANDGLVMPYGYMMETSSVSDRYVNQGFQYKSGGPSSYTQTLTTVSKQRVKANPFGFGISIESLSGRQFAILSALGLSRSGAIF